MDKFLQPAIGERVCRSLPATTLLRALLTFVGFSFVSGVVPAAEPAAKVTLEGTTLIQVEDDFAHGRSRTRYFIRERLSNERLELKLSPEQQKRLRPGQELRVRGRRSGGLFDADPGTDAVTVLAEPAPLAAQTATAPGTTRHVISIIVDISDGSGQVHAIDAICDGTRRLLADEMFATETSGRRNVDGCFRDSSYDVVGFGGTSYPGTAMDVVRVSITEPSSSLEGICPYDTWGMRADAAAVAQGINLGAYQHRMYVLPATTVGCSWQGLAYIGCGDLCQAWVRSYIHPCGLPDTIAHELGHNIGMRHARTDANNDGIPDCEYCDSSDIMGASGLSGPIGNWRGFSAPHRDQMGWLGTGRVVDGAVGGTFTISALGMQSPPYPQAVKIVPPSGWPYWLSYRALIGYDVEIEGRYLGSLQVHRADEWGYSYLITQLADGATHVDEALNLTVRQVSHTDDSATLMVQYGAAFSLSPGSLTFGNQALNVASSAQTLTLLSTGGTALPITSIALGGTNPQQFAQTNDCGTSLAPGASCAVRVTFKPTTIGAKTATLSVTAGGGATAKIVSLSGAGAGPAYTLSASSLAFGNQALNLASSAKTITLRSTGVTALQITSISIGGVNSSQFAQTNNCSSSVAAGASCAIRVTFKPTATGLKPATLSVNAGAAGTKTVALSGTGARAAYTLSVSSLIFGNQPLNLVSSAKTITVHSTGVVALPISSIVIGGTNAAQFARTHNCGTSLAAGASCVIQVTFKPTSTGSKVAMLSVTVGGGATSKTASLSGTGVRSAFSVAPTLLSFGKVARGVTSVAKTVKISNTGTVVLPISSTSLAGTHPGQFARTSNCPARVAVGASCTISVVFKPTATGAKSAILQIVPGGGAALKSVSLSGTGT